MAKAKDTYKLSYPEVDNPNNLKLIKYYEIEEESYKDYDTFLLHYYNDEGYIGSTRNWNLFPQEPKALVEKIDLNLSKDWTINILIFSTIYPLRVPV